MERLQKTLLLAALGFVSLPAAAHAQEGAFRLLTPPAAVAPGISLGTPVPVAPGSAPPPVSSVALPGPAVVRQVSHTTTTSPTTENAFRPVVRGQMEEPQKLFLPKEPVTLPDLPTKGEEAPASESGSTARPGPYYAQDFRHAAIASPLRSILVQFNAWPANIETRPLTEGPVIIDDPGCITAWGAQPYCCQRFYLQADYLLWWTRGDRLPALATTSPSTTPQFDPVTGRPLAGTLADPNGAVLFGNSRTTTGPTSGGRFFAGYWLDPCCTCALEAGFFFLSPTHQNFNTSGGVIGRPFFDVVNGFPNAELVSSPGLQPGDKFIATGSINVDHTSKFFGAEANARQLLCMGCDYRVTGLVGFRYLDLSESLNITEQTTLVKDLTGAGPFPNGTSFVATDAFGTHNRFYGGQVGANAQFYRGPWVLSVSGKLGLGATVQTIDIAGNQIMTTPTGMTSTATGGLLALPSNIGHHTQTRFAVVPEVNMRVGYNLTPNIRIYVGYDLLYWSSVVRPGDQIDTNLNVAQIPNTGLPAALRNTNPPPVVPFRTSPFYAHGLNAGLEIRY